MTGLRTVGISLKPERENWSGWSARSLRRGRLQTAQSRLQETLTGLKKFLPQAFVGRLVCAGLKLSSNQNNLGWAEPRVVMVTRRRKVLLDTTGATAVDKIPEDSADNNDRVSVCILIQRVRHLLH